MRTDQEYLENVERPTIDKIYAEKCLICGKPQSPEHAKTHIADLPKLVLEGWIMPAFGIGEE